MCALEKVCTSSKFVRMYKLTEMFVSLYVYLCWHSFVNGTFQPFGPVGALRRRLLHRNGTLVPPAPSTPLRRQVKTDFRRKWAVAGPFFHQSGQFQGVRRPKFRCGRSRQFVLGVFWALGGPNGASTSCISPRRSDAPGKLSAPKLPFSHINIWSL